MKKEITVSVVGCSLVDCVYAKVDFNSEAFRKYSSRAKGDGGLVAGQLVFMESLEKFAGAPAAQILAELTDNAPVSGRNVGGPAVVAAINAAQLCCDYPVKVNFYGARGKDEGSEFIEKIVRQTPLNIDNYICVDAPTPSTQVLSDPNYHDGKGERTFINVIGAANHYMPEALDDKFFESDVLFFSATALMPPMHDNLTTLLKRGKEAGTINILSLDFSKRKKTTEK